MEMRESNSSWSDVIPSCCLKASACQPELGVKCHPTVVSGWLSERHLYSDKTSKEVYFHNPMWPGTLRSTIPQSRKHFVPRKVRVPGGSGFPGSASSLTSSAYGRVLVLDGILQTTEKDEYAYQEMMANLPLCSIESPKNVLVVGGGDGGTLREICRHSYVELIDICEIDQMVIDVSKKFFPQLAIGFDDPRVHLHICDAIDYVKRVPEGKYGIIIVDGSDPIGPAMELMERPFLETIAKALRSGGVVCNMAESMWLHTHLIQDMVSTCQQVFKGSVRYAWSKVPTYPSGAIGFILCSTEGPAVDFVNPVNPIEKLKDALKYNNELKFYNSEIHRAAFALPSFLKREVEALRDG